MKILIVDDNEDSRVYLERSLKSQGYATSGADNGESALAKAKEWKPNMIISDIMMPEMDGFELCKNIKSNEELKTICFVFYTATFIDNKDRELAISFGASEYIVKPVPPNEFFEIIKNVLKKYENNKLPISPQIEINKHELNERHVHTLTKKLHKKVSDLEKEREALKKSEKNYQDIAKNLKESEELLRNTFEQAAVGIAHLTPEWRFLRINNRFSEILGYTLDEIKEFTFKDITHPNHLKSYIDNTKKLISNNINTHSAEKRFICKDGSIVWVNLTLSVVRDEFGEPRYLTSVIEDISKRKNAEKEINMLAHAIKSIRESVCVTDLEENVIFVNDAFVRAYGFKRDEIEGKPLASLRSQKNPPEILNDILPETLKNGGWQGGIISQKKDRQEFHSFLSTSIIYDQAKSPVALIEVITDVSERVKLEEQLRHSQKMEIVGNLAGGVAHDFNNLLTVINGYTQLLTMGIDKNDPIYSQLEEISNAGKRAENLTRQLLIFSRKEIPQQALLKMSKIVVGIEKMLNRLIGDDIELISDVVDNFDSFYADQGQIEQILMNLIVNARDAMPEGGRILLKSRNVEIKTPILWEDDKLDSGWYLMVAVSDSGFGMTSETIARIFEPFYTTKEVGKGTGLGLSTVYGIVKQWKGFIDVTSEPGKGTTFKIYFPLVKEAHTEVEEVKKVSNFLFGHETILVAEDDDSVRNLVCRVLKMHGYSILEAPHGGSALLKCEQYNDDIHIILCDIVMPEMNGIQLVKRLQTLHPEMKVIFMSGYINNTEMISQIEKKNVAFLQKPFSPDALLKKIREVLG